MIEIKNTRHKTVYIAAEDVSRIHERDYDGGGAVVVCRDGVQLETYTAASELRTAVETELFKARGE